jgi:hypothetical protein
LAGTSVETLLGAAHFAHLAGQTLSKFEGKFTSSSRLPSYEDREQRRPELGTNRTSQQVCFYATVQGIAHIALADRQGAASR